MTSTGKRLQRHERIEEFVKRVAQVRARHVPQAAFLQLFDGGDAEIHQQHLQQIVARDEGIGDERRKRTAIELLKSRSTQRRLSGSDLACQNDEAFAAPDPGDQRIERSGMGRALVQESGIGRQTERLFL